ncbi:MAG: zinc ribbon domain-containing protein [Pseudomonadales bacterium]|jgi:putative FmdB family regulatory protein|nr:zinc ribbon domain-containing protein [Pseudomonadales bacterium]
MPIYEYKCDACAAVLEKIQKFSDPPLRECPECGRETLVKLVSAPSFRLKGSGWYETDFKTGKKKNGAGSEGDGAAPSEGGAAKSGSAPAGEAKADAGKSAEAAASKPASSQSKNSD